MKKVFLYFFIILNTISCVNSNKKNESAENKTVVTQPKKKKPPASFSDTLTIDGRSAVFYYPDSLQLTNLKLIIDSSVFDGITHEYFYQFRYLHNVLNKYWPKIKIVEARNVRYLKFSKGDNRLFEIMDLDLKDDPYGLIVFDPRSKPTQLELTNGESELGFYFKKN